LTQEALAELADLSLTHISHIEVGSNMVSLPALVNICEILKTTADRLLYDNLTQPTAYMSADVAQCFADASPQEASVMLSAARSVKDAMRNVRLSV
jgi:transcriptional regulator with XRE-family HTH domain